MSTERQAMLIYGWTGSHYSIGLILSAFAEKHGIEENTEELVYEIGECYAELFNRNIKKGQCDLEIELRHGQDNDEDGMSYFGLACDELQDLSFDEIMTVQKIMKESFDKTMQGIEHEEPKFSNIVSWY